jgi:F0F1-type ATP synthase membrane subunit b/b'
MTNTVATGTTTGEERSKLEQVSQQTSEVIGSARDQASSIASAARKELGGATQDAKQQAQRLVHGSRRQLRQTADDQTRRFAQTLRDIGDQLQGMAASEQVHDDTLKEVTGQAASTVTRFAQNIDQRGLDGITSDVKRFARQRPGLFIAGALGAGLLVGRLLRSVDTQAIIDSANPSGDIGNGSGNGHEPAALPSMSALAPGEAVTPSMPAPMTTAEAPTMPRTI